MKLVVIALVTSLTLPAAVHAGDMPTYCGSELNTTCPLRISVCPQGDFEAISRGGGGYADYIEVIIIHEEDGPVAGIPVTDFWMGPCDQQYALAPCGEPFFLADSATGPDGRTTFSGRISAGGCVPGGGIYLAFQGNILPDGFACIEIACADIVIVSPDINGDGKVNLSDLSFFGQAYNHNLGDPLWNPCCDYNDDDRCNLSDFSYVGEHYQHGCVD